MTKKDFYREQADSTFLLIDRLTVDLETLIASGASMDLIHKKLVEIKDLSRLVGRYLEKLEPAKI